MAALALVQLWKSPDIYCGQYLCQLCTDNFLQRKCHHMNKICISMVKYIVIPHFKALILSVSHKNMTFKNVDCCVWKLFESCVWKTNNIKEYSSPHMCCHCRKPWSLTIHTQGHCFYWSHGCYGTHQCWECTFGSHRIIKNGRKSSLKVSYRLVLWNEIWSCTHSLKS